MGRPDRPDGRPRTVARLGSAGQGIVSVALGVDAVSTAAGSSSGGSSEKTRTTQLMSAPAGRILVAIARVCITAVAPWVSVGMVVVAGCVPLLLPKKRAAEHLLANIASGQLRVEIEHVYPFTEAPAALAKVQTRHVRGKLVLELP